MRELTKSMLSFSWAMPLYGMKQMLNLSFPRDMSRPFDQATGGFEAVTDAARDQMGSTMKGLFDAGDRIQRGLVDLMFSFVPNSTFDPNAWMRTGSDVMQRSVQGVAQAAAAADATGQPRGAGAPGAGGFPGASVAGGFPGGPVAGGFPGASVAGGFPGGPVAGGFPGGPGAGGAAGLGQAGAAGSQAQGWGPIPAPPTR